MAKGSGTTGSKEEEDKGSKKPLIVRPPKLKNTSANIKQLMKNEEAIRSQIEDAHTEGKFGESERMRLVKMLSPIPSLFDAEKTAEQIAKDHSDTLESLGELLAKSGSGLKKVRFEKGSQEAKDFMASIRAKKGSGVKKCPCKGVCSCCCGGSVVGGNPSGPPPPPPPPPSRPSIVPINTSINPDQSLINGLEELLASSTLPQERKDELTAYLNRLKERVSGNPQSGGKGIKGTGGRSSKAKVVPILPEQTAVEDDRFGSAEVARLPQAVSVAPAPIAQSYLANQEPIINRLSQIRTQIFRISEDIDDIQAREFTFTFSRADRRQIQILSGILETLYREQSQLMELLSPENRMDGSLGIRGTGGRSSKISPAVGEQTAAEGDYRIGPLEDAGLPQAVSVAPAPLAQSYPASEEYDRNRLTEIRGRINIMNDNLINARRMAKLNAQFNNVNEISQDDRRHIQNIENTLRRLYAEQDRLLELITPEIFETEGSGLKKKKKQKN
jgi:hypothetical protein